MSSGKGLRTRQVGEDPRVTRTRADIARTALAVLTTEGADALTHTRVAEVAGYSKTTLYAHWATRLDLLTAVPLKCLKSMRVSRRPLVRCR